jgi:ABC-type molybdate transport system substrate-binding protein
MMTRSLAAAIVAATVGFLALPLPQHAEGGGVPVRVLVSNGMKAAMEELQPQCERAIGHPLAVQYNSTLSVRKMIEAGQGFDVTLITTEAIDDLIKQGKLSASSRVALARSELGIGIKSGVPKPDIKTVDDAETDDLRNMPWQLVHRFVVREQTQADRIFGASQNSGDNPGELMSRAKGKPGTASRFSKQSRETTLCLV